MRALALLAIASCSMIADPEAPEDCCYHWPARSGVRRCLAAFVMPSECLTLTCHGIGYETTVCVAAEPEVEI